jgi:enolase
VNISPEAAHLIRRPALLALALDCMVTDFGKTKNLLYALRSAWLSAEQRGLLLARLVENYESESKREPLASEEWKENVSK